MEGKRIMRSYLVIKFFNMFLIFIGIILIGAIYACHSPKKVRMDDTENDLIVKLFEKNMNEESMNEEGSYVLNKLDPNLNLDNGIRMLHIAAQEGRNDIIEMLLEHGADINAYDSNNWTALHFAAAENFVNTMELLLVKGAMVDAKDKTGATPLHFVCQEGFLAAARLLLKHGANPKSKTEDGLTPIFLASSNHHIEITELVEGYINNEN